MQKILMNYYEYDKERHIIMVDVYLLPANEGDCLWVRYGKKEGTRHNIIIDGGVESNGGDIASIIENIAERNEKVDIFVTHIDGDHIRGLIKGIGISNAEVLKNNGEEDLGVEYVSSFALLGIDKEGLLSTDEKLEVLIARNAWQKELIWNRFSMDQLGMSISQPDKVRRSSQTISVGNTGNWSTNNYLPMGCLKNKETDSILFWQIEQNGSWYWEISDQDGHMYLQLSGPTEHQSHWWKNLKPGDTFASVPVSVGSACGDVEEAAGELTKYRRAIRRKNKDNEKLPVIFNDYMNCLWGDPTTEKELPLIDKAKEAGCEYFCVDCGWYSAGFWWDGVGEWLPSKERFPGGLKEVMDYIRSKGMVPGVWLELEVMGIKCPKADKVPDDWYFLRQWTSR